MQRPSAIDRASLAPLRPDSVASAVLLCAFLMAPAALCSGFLFTALGARLRGAIDDAAAATGALTFANTLGAMAGSLLAAFVLLPAAGVEEYSCQISGRPRIASSFLGADHVGSIATKLL